MFLTGFSILFLKKVIYINCKKIGQILLSPEVPSLCGAQNNLIFTFLFVTVARNKHSGEIAKGS